MYALYKGEEFLCMGTIYQIAKEQNVGIGTIKYYKTNAYKRKLDKRNSKNARILIKIEDD